jgi:hypothetical protein
VHPWLGEGSVGSKQEHHCFFQIALHDRLDEFLPDYGRGRNPFGGARDTVWRED